MKDYNLPRAPLDFCVCVGCGLAQLRDTTDPDLHFANYWYKSGINETMREALKNVVTDASHYANGGTWIDVGANDGTLLSFVPPTFKRIGVEPAVNLADELATKADEVVTHYFGAVELSKADVITSIAMFYDLEDPVAFCRSVRESLQPQGVWLNQLSYTPLMLKKNAFDNICHEHLCYYNLRTLRDVYNRAGLSLLSVSYNDTNGGSIRTLACRDDAKVHATSIIVIAEDEDYDGFGKRVTKWKQTTQDVLYYLSRRRFYGYGASTKGNVLLQYLDNDYGYPSQLIKGIADRNPAKHGLLTVGTWIPIVTEDQARREAATMLVLPWAFRDEFIQREAKWLADGGQMIFPLPHLEVVI